MVADRVVIKRQRDRRFWQQQVEAWQQSGFSPREYAKQHQLCNEQFKRWRYRLKREVALGQGSFIAVTVAASEPLLGNSHRLTMTGLNGVQVALELPAERSVSFIKELLCGH